MYDLVIKNGLVYSEESFQKKHVYIANGKIADISSADYPAKTSIDVSGLEVLPGIIDPHVHFALDLGTISSKDDFLTGSIAAAYGGVTTIIDFLDPTADSVSVEKAYHKRLKEAQTSCIDYTFHATIKAPKNNLEAYVKTVKTLGLHSLKFFTTYSESHRKTSDEAIKKLLTLSKKYNLLLLGHIENDALIHHDERFTYRDLKTSRPSVAETVEALKMVEYLKHSDGKLYMVHVSSGNTLEAIIETGRSLLGKQLFLESCPQYFTFTDKILDSSQGALYTFAPPVRSQAEQDLLFKYQSYLHTFATDHCAFNKEDKQAEKLSDIPLGIGSIEHSFGIMRYHFGEHVINRMSKSVATLFQLKQKGSIAIGNDADIHVFDPTPHTIQSHHGGTNYTPYIGVKSAGQTVHTLVRGQFVIKNKKLIKHRGKLIRSDYNG